MLKTIKRTGDKEAVVRKVKFYGKKNWSTGLAKVWVKKLRAGGVEEEHTKIVLQLEKFIREAK